MPKHCVLVQVLEAIAAAKEMHALLNMLTGISPLPDILTDSGVHRRRP